MKAKTASQLPSRVYCAAMLLLCLTLVTSSFTAGLYARFSTAAESGDSARLASFHFSAEGELTQSFFIDGFQPSSSVQKQLRISYSGEVAVEYTVTVTTTGNLPLTFSIDGEPSTEGASVAGEFNVGEGAREYTLTILWPQEQKSYVYNNELDMITVNVVCKQID